LSFGNNETNNLVDNEEVPLINIYPKPNKIPPLNKGRLGGVLK